LAAWITVETLPGDGLVSTKRKTSSADGLLTQLEEKSKCLSAVESFLMANWPNEAEEGASVQSLVESTLAFHLANEDERIRLTELFNALAENIAVRLPDASMRRRFSRTLFGVADNIEIQNWVESNAGQMVGRANTFDLLANLWPLFLRFITNKPFRRCNPQGPLFNIAEAWIKGRSFAELYDILREADCRLGERKPKIESVVDICESGFGFDGMLIVGAVLESLEAVRPDELRIFRLLRNLQKEVKYLLSSGTAIELYEMGFADRGVSQELSELTGAAGDSRSIRRQLIASASQVRSVLSNYPSYFSAVYDGLARPNT
jgi:hypothetical protein